MRDHHGVGNLGATLELVKPGARVRGLRSSPGLLDQDTPAETTTNRGASEIVPGNVSGGTNTSQTILTDAFAALLDAVTVGSERREYESAAIEGNVLRKQTLGSRRRTFRHLRELYLLRPDSILFRALRDLWLDDSEARPLLAGLCALARDAVFRASSPAIFRATPGDPVTAADLAAAVGDHFPTSYGSATLAKIGRNCFSSWQQTGHLGAASRGTKVRKHAACRQANVTYALLLGHLQGVRGEALFETLWAKMLDQPKSQLFDLAHGGSQRGLMEFRHAGGVVEVGFRQLLRPVEGAMF
jgi:hypothetical protein